MVPKFCFERNFTSEIGTKETWDNKKYEKRTLIWYTDGSQSSVGAGAGIFGPKTKYFESAGVNLNIFQAEVLAIERCTQINLGRNYRKQIIVIMSDSQAAIKALSSYKISSKMVWDCRTKLNNLGTNNKVILKRIPGHTGVKGNEEADRLANQGARKTFIGP